MRVTRSTLGPLSFLAEGAFGKVYRVDRFRLPGDSTALAFKEFTSEQAEQARAASTAVAFRDALNDADRSDLDLYCAWPRALVEDDNGAVAGFLMQLIPPDFFCRRADPASGAIVSTPCQLDWLIASDKQRHVAQLDLREIDDTERLILLARLIYAVGRLHRQGWVFGDLSFNNAVFALDPPRVMLVDCDGAAPLADLTRKQFSTPFWDPPESPNSNPLDQRHLLDDVTDVYKLGLAILRCMTPGKWAASDRSVSRLNGELDAEGTTLLDNALSGTRASRPPAKQLYSYFRRIVAARVTPPEVTAARLVTPLRVRGQDARIEWQISNANKITVLAGMAQRFAVDLASYPGGFVFRPDESGPVILEAINRFGTLRVDLGELSLYELPPFSLDLTRLPGPSVPAIAAFTLEPMGAMAESRPRIRVPEMPPVPILEPYDLVDVLTPGPALVTLPRFDDAIDAFDDVVHVVRTQAREFAVSWRQTYLENSL
jgi:serine/threonine protein kinase